jgi:hypothetical protein
MALDEGHASWVLAIVALDRWGSPYWERWFPTGSGRGPPEVRAPPAFQACCMPRRGGWDVRPEPIEYRRSQYRLLPATRQVKQVKSA